jgi:hypothetical protein
MTTSVYNDGPSTARNIRVQLSSSGTFGVAAARYTSGEVETTTDARYVEWRIAEVRSGESTHIDALFAIDRRADGGGHAALEARIAGVEQTLADDGTSYAKRLVFLVNK